MSENKLKIALGMKLKEGAFGGGNQFGWSLRRFLDSQNIEVVFDLKENDIDLILLTETRRWLESATFDATDVLRYLARKPDTLVVFRVNECDERKGVKIKLLNKLIIQSAGAADRIVFVSHWLQNNFGGHKKIPAEKSAVALNGADAEIFNAEGYRPWNKNEPLKIVTHHWGAHWFKGFDAYLKLDELIGKKYRETLRFAFIGLVPPSVHFKNSEVVSALSGKELAQEIKKHHVYLTASINEPAGMHNIEGALCGLPLLYRQSGAMPEYCAGYGLSFTGPEDLEEKINLMKTNYENFIRVMPNYPHTADKMNRRWLEIIEETIKNKEEIIIKRKKRLFLWEIFKIIALQTLLRLKEKFSSLLKKFH